MKKIYSTLLFALLGAPMLTSCVEEVNPQTSYITAEQGTSAPGAFDKFVTSLTSTLNGQFTYNGSNHSVWDYGYPSFFLTRDVEGQDVIPVGTNNWYKTWYNDVSYLAPGWAVTQLPWTYYFTWIKNCNSVIAMVNGNPKDTEKPGLGIAYAIRAMMYLDIARMYAAESYNSNPQALTVPKITEATSFEQAANNPRVPFDEMLDFIISDLDEAEKYLDGYVRADVYTPDVSVVYGLKARAYLEKQDYPKAAEYAKKAQAGYTIMDEAAYTSRDTGFNSPNKSWMFGLTFRPTDPNILENDGDSSWGSVMILENGFDSGYAANYGGPNVIDRHLYETIPATDFRKKCFVDFAIDDMEEEDMITALEAYSYYPERLLATADAAQYGPGGLSLKFRNASGKADVKYDAWVVAVPLMRVEEMYLIEAEAVGMQPGKENEGIQLLTQFALTRDPAYVYGTHNEAYYNMSTPKFQNEVWWQRRVELWGEGFATFDIRRLDKGIIRSYANSNHIEGFRWNTPDGVPNWMIWCFGGTEPDYNKGLVQNPNPVQPDGDSPEFTW